MRTVVSIYIVIPILLIPQILLGGAIIKFDKLNSKITNQLYVPFVGDLMPSRWAYEGMAVYQFAENKYEKQLFYSNTQVSNISYRLNYYLPELLDLLTEIKNNLSINNLQEYEVKQKIELLIFEISELKLQMPVCEKYLANVNDNVFNTATAIAVEKYLNCCRAYYIYLLDEAIKAKDKKIKELEKLFEGHSGLIDFRNLYYNESLAKTVLNKTEPIKIEIKQNQIIRKFEPVYHLPESRFGRCHFYSAEKRIGPVLIETFWFNIFILLLMIIGCYLLLVFDLVIRLKNKIHINHVHVKKVRFNYMSVILRLLMKN
jgi:hypothetical protein